MTDKKKASGTFSSQQQEGDGLPVQGPELDGEELHPGEDANHPLVPNSVINSMDDTHGGLISVSVEGSQQLDAGSVMTQATENLISTSVKADLATKTPEMSIQMPQVTIDIDMSPANGQMPPDSTSVSDQEAENGGNLEGGYHGQSLSNGGLCGWAMFNLYSLFTRVDVGRGQRRADFPSAVYILVAGTAFVLTLHVLAYSFLFHKRAPLRGRTENPLVSTHFHLAVFFCVLADLLIFLDLFVIEPFF